jgi:glycosyltransferase involved in cell wall biosynthesis
MVATGSVQDEQMHQQFARSDRSHVLMITNHGVHEWKVVPGLPDTGGQNVYVNSLTEALVDLGYRVTIINRGGYPHPVTGDTQTGLVYHPTGFARIMYVEDDVKEFVRKEDMDDRLPQLADDLLAKLEADGDTYDLIISNYWDAGKLGNLINDRNSKRVPHVWIPHSLGALKKRNMAPSTWADLRIDERIGNELELIRGLDGGVATSTAIRETFTHDYEYDARYFLPPCVDDERYYRRSEQDVAPIWDFLAEHSSLSADQIKQRKIITEISRTDKTKRKDVLIKAFAEVKKQAPEALLVVSVDAHVEALYLELTKLIEDLSLKDDVIVLGSVWAQLPLLYNATDIYCTPSVMEGFGMSAQEAAATAKPVVSSDLVPFVCEYLLGPDPEHITMDANNPSLDLLRGEGGIVVPADHVDGFAAALLRLLQDDGLRTQMGERAHEITIPYFTWPRMTKALLDDLGVSPTATGNGQAKA